MLLENSIKYSHTVVESYMHIVAGIDSISVISLL